MASKIFCCCCQTSEESSATIVSHSTRISQQPQPRTFNLNTNPRKNGLQKRYVHHPTNKWMLKACNLRRP
uniref:Testis expressed 53 n=1 Tax=Neovison vison TaxID=452646 RepID=A0A8C7EN62_NEOVI